MQRLGGGGWRCRQEGLRRVVGGDVACRHIDAFHTGACREPTAQVWVLLSKASMDKAVDDDCLGLPWSALYWKAHDLT